MSNIDWIARFEAAAISPAEFHHREHIRMAWCYLREFPFAEGAARFTSALRGFAAANGTPTLYHETITWAYLVLVNQRMRKEPSTEWETFAAANADLFLWRPSILDSLYRRETLTSDLAREVFLLPDAATS